MIFLFLPFPCEAIRLSDLPAGILQFGYENASGESNILFPVGYDERAESRVICFAWKRQSVWTQGEFPKGAGHSENTEQIRYATRHEESSILLEMA